MWRRAGCDDGPPAWRPLLIAPPSHSHKHNRGISSLPHATLSHKTRSRPHHPTLIIRSSHKPIVSVFTTTCCRPTSSRHGRRDGTSFEYRELASRRAGLRGRPGFAPQLSSPTEAEDEVWAAAGEARTVAAEEAEHDERADDGDVLLGDAGSLHAALEHDPASETLHEMSCRGSGARMSRSTVLPNGLKRCAHVLASNGRSRSTPLFGLKRAFTSSSISLAVGAWWPFRSVAVTVWSGTHGAGSCWRRSEIQSSRSNQTCAWTDLAKPPRPHPIRCASDGVSKPSRSRRPRGRGPSHPP